MMLRAPWDTETPQAVPPEGLSMARLAVVYGNAFSTGFLVMAFEMLGSRYLIPFFGAGIYTWAALISTVLVALAAGYFFGGAARRPPAFPLPVGRDPGCGGPLVRGGPRAGFAHAGRIVGGDPG